MKQRKFIAIIAMVLVLVLCIGVFAACDNDKKNPPPRPADEDSYITVADYRAYMKFELADALNKVRNGGASDDVIANAQAAHDAGVNAINDANTIALVRTAYNNAVASIANCVPYASGLYNFFTADVATKTTILGKLEEYAVNTGITGMTLYENGGLVMYSDRAVLGTENYIPNYGFGLLAEGHLRAPMDSESVDAWKMYLHSVQAEDPGSANYLDGEDSLVSDAYGYISTSFYEIFMNATKDGYDWVPSLAVADPTPVNPDENGNASQWRIELRKDLKYSTLSSMSDRSAFNNREVQLEDFLNGYKLLMNYANAYFRGTEEAGKTGASSIVGLKDYYDATKSYYESLPEGQRDSAKGILTDAQVNFSKYVHVSVSEENGHWYFNYELGDKVTPYYARYYVNNTMTMPVPKAFIDLVGADEYCGFSSDTTRTPVDNSLSLGAYTLERWDAGQQIVYKKNPNYVYAGTKYQIAGVHINILPAILTNNEASFNEFIAGNTDSTSIPETKIEQYASDPRTRKTTGDTTMKINFNALNAEDWAYFFGENGVVSQSSPEDYWDVKPAMANSHFRSALSYAFDRVSFAARKGCVASVNFLSSAYMSDNENGVAYDLTQAHEDAVEKLLTDTDGNGYSLELARDYFRMALAELEADGAYTPGTAENPTVITIKCMWWNNAMEENYHKYLKQAWEEAFNDESVSGGRYKLVAEFEVGGADTDAAYDRLQNGQFDIGFGAITGMTLNPLGFMSSLSTDQSMSGGFTLNWGVNTNDPDAELLVYNGMRWSYDALWKSTDTTSAINNGKYNPDWKAWTGDMTVVEGADSATVTITLTFADEVTDVNIEDVLLFGYVDIGETYVDLSVMDLLAQDVDIDTDNHTVTIVLNIPYGTFSRFVDLTPYYGATYCGFDIIGSYKIPMIGLEADTGAILSPMFDEIPSAPSAEE